MNISLEDDVQTNPFLTNKSVNSLCLHKYRISDYYSSLCNIQASKNPYIGALFVVLVRHLYFSFSCFWGPIYFGLSSSFSSTYIMKLRMRIESVRLFHEVVSSFAQVLAVGQK